MCFHLCPSLLEMGSSLRETDHEELTNLVGQVHLNKRRLLRLEEAFSLWGQIQSLILLFVLKDERCIYIWEKLHDYTQLWFKSSTLPIPRGKNLGGGEEGGSIAIIYLQTGKVIWENSIWTHQKLNISYANRQYYFILHI